MITVVIADDHPMVRQGLSAVLLAAGDIDIVGQASDGREAVELVVGHEPDVVLMDLQMPVLHGLDATREIVARGLPSSVLVLTMYEDDDTLFAAVGAGAAGYLLKGADGADIVAAVRSTAAGHTVLGAALGQRLRAWMSGAPTALEPPFPELTERERAILDQLAAGLTNAAIGEHLHLSGKTVANNVSNILNKLHLVNRSEAIVRARESGLGTSRAERGTAEA